MTYVKVGEEGACEIRVAKTGPVRMENKQTTERKVTREENIVHSPQTIENVKPRHIHTDKQINTRERHINTGK